MNTRDGIFVRLMVEKPFSVFLHRSMNDVAQAPSVPYKIAFGVVIWTIMDSNPPIKLNYFIGGYDNKQTMSYYSIRDLYVYSAQGYYVGLHTMTDESCRTLLDQVESILQHRTAKEKGIMDYLMTYLGSWEEEGVDIAYHNNKGSYHFMYYFLMLISQKHPTIGRADVISYRATYVRYRVEEGKETYRTEPFSIRMTPSDEWTGMNAHRIHYYEEPPAATYTVVYCLKRDETLKGGHLVFYPQYHEENTFTELLTHLVTRCSSIQREIEVPLRKGSVVILSGDVCHALQSFQGHGECILMMYDVYLSK